jgi:chitooligosaccharide deacetylase
LSVHANGCDSKTLGWLQAVSGLYGFVSAKGDRLRRDSRGWRLWFALFAEAQQMLHAKLVDRAWQLTARMIDGVGRRTIDRGFDDLMSAGCKIIRRFENSDAVYLTFDDGPNPNTTQRLLHALHRERVKGTFFCIGRNARRWPALVQSIARAGHALGNHSMTHPDLYRVGPRRLRNELDACQETLQSIAGPVTLFRAPYGHFRWDLRFAGATGIKHLIKWDIAPPWNETDPVRLADLILASARPGSIILLHDGLATRDAQLSASAGRAAAECVSLIAPEIRSRGLEFKTIAEQVREVCSREDAASPMADAAA